MHQIRQYASKGDVFKAKRIAQQIASYRSAADRNFDAQVTIQTRAQVIQSF
jgi:hypothetical protein